MHTVSYEFLIKPKESAECHQTLSFWVGSSNETNSRWHLDWGTMQYPRRQTNLDYSWCSGALHGRSSVRQSTSLVLGTHDAGSSVWGHIPCSPVAHQPTQLGQHWEVVSVQWGGRASALWYLLVLEGRPAASCQKAPRMANNIQHCLNSLLQLEIIHHAGKIWEKWKVMLYPNKLRPSREVKVIVHSL